MLTFRRLICLLLALGLLTISAVAEMPNPTLDPTANPYDETHPELLEGRMAGVFVETQGAVTLGKTVTDLQSDKKFGVQNALVLLHLDREKFMQILKDCIRTLP